ncbi:MAG: hypothetical protein WC158_02860 [Candidatus Paceibacterota bacterium]
MRFFNNLFLQFAFLDILLGASSVFSRATIIAVKSAVAFGELRRKHRAARAFEKSDKWKIMPLFALAGLAPIRQNFLHFRKQLLCDERAVFALVGFAVPAHNADIAVIGQKVFNGVIGARFSAAKLGEAS